MYLNMRVGENTSTLRMFVRGTELDRSVN